MSQVLFRDVRILDSTGADPYPGDVLVTDDRIAAVGEVDAVADLAELISLCGQLRAEGRDGDGAVWAASAAQLGTGTLAACRDALRLDGDAAPLEQLAREAAGDEAVERALAAHAGRVG